MGLGCIYNKVALLSPRMEVALRKLYWYNINRLGKFNPNNKTKKIEMIVMINRALKRTHDNLECDLPTSNPFNNVSKNYWGYQHLLEAVSTHTCWYY